MQESKYFDQPFKETMINEGWGKETKDPNDPGGHSWSGISRVYWPNWEGWAIIDTAERPFYPAVVQQLMAMAREFYKKNFWDIFQGDARAEYAPTIAAEVFDTAVNVGPDDAVRFLQEGYNVARGEMGQDLVVDGRLGPKTIAALKEYLADRDQRDAQILLNCCNGEQYIWYKRNPRRRKFRGWFTRV